MPLKKILVGVTLVAFLGSDFAFGIAPALGQSPGAGNGQVPMPSLGGNSDGFGRVLPGVPTSASLGAAGARTRPLRFRELARSRRWCRARNNRRRRSLR